MSGIVFLSPEDGLRNKYNEYAAEHRRLRQSGELSVQEAQDWEYKNSLDGTKFPKLLKLWNECLALYAQTNRGRQEHESAKVDSLIVPPVDESKGETDPLDAIVLSTISNLKSWKGSVEQLARLVDTDKHRFLESFRRVRERLEGCSAFEILLDGSLGIEVVRK